MEPHRGLERRAHTKQKLGEEKEPLRAADMFVHCGMGTKMLKIHILCLVSYVTDFIHLKLFLVHLAQPSEPGALEKVK